MESEQLLLFGGYLLEPVPEESSKKISRLRGILDDWIAVESPCGESFMALSNARQVVNDALEYKVMHPKSSLPDETQAVLDCIADFLGADELESSEEFQESSLFASNSLSGAFEGQRDNKE